MRKQGSLDGIILLVISFSVINYVVSKSVRLRQADTLFLCTFVQKKECQSRFTHGGRIPRDPLGRSALPLAPHRLLHAQTPFNPIPIVARLRSRVQRMGR